MTKLLLWSEGVPPPSCWRSNKAAGPTGIVHGDGPPHGRRGHPMANTTHALHVIAVAQVGRANREKNSRGSTILRLAYSSDIAVATTFPAPVWSSCCSNDKHGNDAEPQAQCLRGRRSDKDRDRDVETEIETTSWVNDEDIPATLDVNKGDGLRHKSHEENEDDVNQVDGLRLSKNDPAYHGQLRATVLGRYNKSFTPEDIITMPRRMGYVEDDKGYVKEESAHAQRAAVYANKKMIYTAKAQFPRLVRPIQSWDGCMAYMVRVQEASDRYEFGNSKD
uniref:Uncharacterized protein n=1 Tax=Oryza sativa subsp. japonica TaxID=39947 RepID=Q6ZIY7_ORYSJ|nr:hypothetical protein [Oryza sativa Japonica Group]